jgi:hypothetical protein
MLDDVADEHHIKRIVRQGQGCDPDPRLQFQLRVQKRFRR